MKDRTVKTIGGNTFFRSKSGFTLLEVLIAVTILAIAAIMIMRTTGNSVRLQAESEYLVEAVFLAQQIMLEQESLPALVPADEELEFEGAMKRFRYRKQVENAGFPNVYHIMVTIIHDDRELITVHEYVSKNSTEQ